MKKLLDILGRTALMAGLLVALTPCGLCHSSSMKTLSAGHSCCAGKAGSPNQGHSRGPLCQVMDQSSTSAVPVHLDLPSVEIAPVSFTPEAVRSMAVFPPSVVIDVSPPRSPEILRI